MRKTTLVIVLAALFASATNADTRSIDPIAEAIASGDSAYRVFDYDKAIKCYESARAKSSNRDVLLKLADAYFYGGYQKPKAQQEPMYLNAKDVLLCALKLDSTSAASAEVYARLGQVTGQLALFRGGNEKIKLGLEIKQFADKALERNPNNAMANAILGIWHYELANLDFVAKAFVKVFFGGVPDGSFEFAEKYLAKAVSLQPNVIYYRNAYAKTLVKLGKEEDARAQLKRALELPLMVAGDKQNKRESKELLMQM
jgi:tetratricopeptide (TPR) repeat protein